MNKTKQFFYQKLFLYMKTFWKSLIKILFIDSDSTRFTTSSGKKGKDQKQQISQEEEAQEVPVERKGQWVTTAPTGERVSRKLDGTDVEVENALVSYASDPESGQVSAVYSLLAYLDKPLTCIELSHYNLL